MLITSVKDHTAGVGVPSVNLVVPQIMIVPGKSVAIDDANEKRIVVFPPAPTIEITGV
jgi:hypothetical protein